MRHVVTIGQTWRRRDGRLVRIRQVHRAEQRVEVTDGTHRRFQLTFRELRRFQLQTEDQAA